MGELGSSVKLRFLCLNLGVERFSSTLLRVVKNKGVEEGWCFKYGGFCKAMVAWNS